MGDIISISISLKEHVDILRKVHKTLDESSHYQGNSLYHGRAADSSDYGTLAMRFIKRAEAEFIEEHQGMVIQKAVDLVEKELTELGLPVKELEGLK
jgi:hypothetical protein